MVAVPEISNTDLAFGNIQYLPEWNSIPDEFKNGRSAENKLVTKWFFGGLDDDDLKRITPREGIDKKKALRACAACLRSWEPKHEHKEAGVAYLIHQWFELQD